MVKHFNSFPAQQIFDSSKRKEFADDNFIFDEIGKKLSKWVKNTGKRRNCFVISKFLLFLQCFQKNCTADTLKPGLVWERFKCCKNNDFSL